MRIRSFIIGYTLVLALLLFAFQRPALRPQNSFSQVVDLTVTTLVKTGSETRSGTRIISPAALVAGTWGAAQIPADRLIGPLVVMDLNPSSEQISVDDIAVSAIVPPSFGPQIGQAFGWAWKRRLTGLSYSSRHCAQSTKSRIVVFARSQGISTTIV
jgi:hypothetical protein